MRTTAGPVDDAAIPAYLNALGVPGIADVHVHFMPQNVLDKVWNFFDRVGDGDGDGDEGPRGAGARNERPQKWGIHYRTPEDVRVATLERMGVIAYPTLNYAHRPGMAAWLNAYSTDFAARHPRAVHSGTFFAEASAAADTEAALAAGARIFKIHVQVGEFAPDDPILDGAWAALASARVPAVVHCGSGPHAGQFTGPARMAALLHRHPDLQLIIAHGGMPEYAAFTDLAHEYAGVCLDTTMVCTDFAGAFAPVPAAVLARWRRMPQKIVLGTDFPNIPYAYAHQIRVLADLDFGDDWMRAVLWRNGARLMGVAGSAADGGMRHPGQTTSGTEGRHGEDGGKEAADQAR